MATPTRIAQFSRFAILTNRTDGFALPMAQGLARMLGKIGVEGWLFYDGLDMLYLHGGYAGTLRATFRNLWKLARFRTQLRQCQAIVVVSHLPEAFIRPFQVERLRQWMPRKPIILYDLIYLLSGGKNWNEWLKSGKPDHPQPILRQGGHWGIERYDWYWVISVVSNEPLPAGNHRLTQIGIDLDDGSLYPEQNGTFVALLDFESPVYLRHRAIQIQALEETQTPYRVLHGHYPIAEIRQIYRRTSLYFLASHESFGLPICEVQASGGYVATPYPDWPSAHGLGGTEGNHALSDNFVVYGDDRERLKSLLRQLKQQHAPEQVVQTFRKNHPHFWHGDVPALEKSVAALQNGLTKL